MTFTVNLLYCTHFTILSCLFSFTMNKLPWLITKDLVFNEPYSNYLFNPSKLRIEDKGNYTVNLPLNRHILGYEFNCHRICIFIITNSLIFLKWRIISHQRLLGWEHDHQVRCLLPFLISLKWRSDSITPNFLSPVKYPSPPVYSKVFSLCFLLLVGSSVVQLQYCHYNTNIFLIMYISLYKETLFCCYFIFELSMCYYVIYFNFILKK